MHDAFFILRRVATSRQQIGDPGDTGDAVQITGRLLTAEAAVKIRADTHRAGVASNLADVINVVNDPFDRHIPYYLGGDGTIMMVRAVLLSGVMDSAALTAQLRPAWAFAVDYGQVCAETEVRAAQAVARQLGIRSRVLHADCSAIGSGDLAGQAALSRFAPSPEWWPYRNHLLASLSASVALEQGVSELLFGTVRTDRTHTGG